MTDAEVAANYIACPTTGCWIWCGMTRPGGGYGTFLRKRSDNGKWQRLYAHRIVLALKLGRPIGPGLNACHSCDRPCCIRPDHLWEGTDADNVADRIRKGRSRYAPREKRRYYLRPEETRGERNPGAKLTWAKVDEIRACGRSISAEALGKRYGVSPDTIRSVINGRNWPEEHRPHA